MRKKDRLEKKRRKRLQRRFTKGVRKAEQRGATRRLRETVALFLQGMLSRQSIIQTIFPAERVLVPPYNAALIDRTGVVHWSTLVDKANQPKETWPRVTLCDANRDLAQAACTLTDVHPTCVECIAREGA